MMQATGIMKRILTGGAVAGLAVGLSACSPEPEAPTGYEWQEERTQPAQPERREQAPAPEPAPGQWGEQTTPAQPEE